MQRARLAAVAVSLLAPWVSARGVQAAPERAESRFGPRSIVAGQAVTDEMIELWIALGPARDALEQHKLRWIIDRELAERTQRLTRERLEERRTQQPFASREAEEAARASIAEAIRRGLETTTLDVAEAVEREFAAALADFAKRFPELDALTELRRSKRSPELFREELRLARIFERLFLPSDANARPDASVRALRATLKDQYDRYAKPWRTADGSLDPQYQRITRQAARDGLAAEMRFSTSLEGPDFSIALRADPDGDGRADRELTTAELWRDVEPTVSRAEIEDARAYWQLVLATRAALEREGRWLTKSERDAAWEALRGQLSEFVPTLDALAMLQERFPSTESYREFQGLVKSFRARLEPQLVAADGGPSELLLADLPRTLPRLAGVRIDAEVLLVSGYDFARAQWKPDGRAGAIERANALASDLRANAKRWEQRGERAQPEASTVAPDELWKRALDEKSEWWDPPLPKDRASGAPDFLRKNKGRFGPRAWSELAELLEITRYEQWLRGEELVEALCSRLPLGEIGGPYPTRWGACLVRVKSRRDGERAIDPKHPAQHAVLALEFIDQRFREYGREAVRVLLATGSDPGAK